MPIILIILGIYLLAVGIQGNATEFVDRVFKNAEGAGPFLIGWIILLIFAKLWRPFYYLAIAAGLGYILLNHSKLSTNLQEIYNDISTASTNSTKE